MQPYGIRKSTAVYAHLPSAYFPCQIVYRRLSSSIPIAGTPRGHPHIEAASAQCPSWVKSGKVQTEQMFSGLSLKADATRL